MICPLMSWQGEGNTSCKEGQCAWWIYKPQRKQFDGAKGYDVVWQEEVKMCAIRIMAENILKCPSP